MRPRRNLLAGTVRSGTVLDNFRGPFSLPTVSPPPGGNTNFRKYDQRRVTFKTFHLTITFPMRPNSNSQAARTLRVGTLPQFIRFGRLPSVNRFTIVTRPDGHVRLRLTSTIRRIRATRNNVNRRISIRNSFRPIKRLARWNWPRLYH